MSSSRCSEFHKIFEFQSIGLMPIQEDFLIFRKDRGFFVLADGFGGPGSGDQIAQTACEAIEYFLEKEAGDEDATLPFHLRSYFTIPGNVLFNAVLYANKKILEFNKGRPLSKRGGCSLIVGMIHQGTLALAQVGLCRAHLRRGSAWKQLNQERSF
jgi:serine/threonine protein phosphatase PrpC